MQPEISTFQAIVYGIIAPFTEFFPIPADAVARAAETFLHWPTPNERIQAFFVLPMSLVLLWVLRHDWASLISNLLQVIIFRKRPTALDERMPFFLLLTTFPLAAVALFLRLTHETLFFPTWVLPASLVVSSGILLIVEGYGRKNRNMFAWNGGDTFAAGVLQLLALLPGVHKIHVLWNFGFLRNYSKEAIIKYSLMAIAPFLFARTWVLWATTTPSHAGQMSLVSNGIAILIVGVTTYFLLEGLLKNAERGSLRLYAFIGVILGGVIGTFEILGRLA